MFIAVEEICLKVQANVTAGCCAVEWIDGYDVIAHELMCNNLGDVYDCC
jgi:hypothetical protein